MTARQKTLARDVRVAKSLFGDLSVSSHTTLVALLRRTRLSLAIGDLTLLNGAWYVTGAGLLRLALNRHCLGIHSRPVLESSNPLARRWVFRATVYTSPECKGFVGYGDADPSNVSPLVHGAEMRVAETRAVNRALRKAYGIGICSVDEIGSSAGLSITQSATRKLPPQPANGNSHNGNGSKVRDRLCLLIRQHQLDASLVKSYATDFCGTKTLREATREQVENFVVHLADWAEKDRNALLCHLNSYSRAQAGAA